MLALNSLFVTSCRTLGLAAVVVSSALVGVTNGQQTPAQRYEPVRSNIYDTKEAQSDYYPEQVHREGVRQVAYQRGVEPAVPAILSGAKSPVRRNTIDLPAAASTRPVGSVETMPRKSPADFASQMGMKTNSFRPIQSNRQVTAPAVKTIKSASIPVGVIPQTNTLPIPQTPKTKPAPPTTPIAKSTIRQVVADTPVERSPVCLLYTSPSPRDGLLSRMPSSA